MQAAAVVADAAALESDAAVASDAQHGIHVLLEVQPSYLWVDEDCITTYGDQALDTPAGACMRAKGQGMGQQQQSAVGGQQSDQW